MNTVPLRGMVDVRRDVIDTSAMPGIVEHFSIPALDAGSAELVDSVNIDSHKLRLLGGEILISRLNPRKPRVHLVPSALRAFAVASTEFVSLVPRGSEARFLRYYLLSETVRQHLDAHVRSATRSHQRVEPDVILRLHVPSFALDEQRRIAGFLDDRVSRIDQIIDARREQLHLINAARSSCVDEAFLANSHERVEVRRLLRERPSYGCLPAFVSERTDWPRYIRTTDIEASGKLRTGGIVTVAPGHLAEHRLFNGDVLVARSGNTIGKCIIYIGDADAVYAGYLVRMRFRDVNPASFWYFSKSTDFTEQLWANAIQSTIPNFNAERYAAMTMPDIRGREHALLAKLEDQFESIARNETQLTSSIDLLTEYKSSLITAAVTGELDVTTAGSNIPG